VSGQNVASFFSVVTLLSTISGQSVIHTSVSRRDLSPYQKLQQLLVECSRPLPSSVVGELR